MRITVNQDGIVPNGSGSDERIDCGQPRSRGTPEFNGFQKEVICFLPVTVVIMEKAQSRAWRTVKGG